MKNSQLAALSIASSAKHWMGRLLGKSKAASSLASSARMKVERVWLVQERPSATVDYIVSPVVAEFNVPIASYYLDKLPETGASTSGTLIVLVRYVNDRWRSYIDARRDTFAGVIYFMDDDLFDRDALRGLPAQYIKKIERLVLKHRNWLSLRSSGFWVSSAALAIKYAGHNPRVIGWAPPQSLLARSTPTRVFYHGSASHLDEQRWLKEVVAGVLHRCESVHFEIIGDMSINRMYRDLPRVTILHPMSWQNYLSFSQGATRDIGLAPLLPSQFNAGRGPTKFFDIARLGGVGVYSKVSPYSDFIQNEVDGVLVANTPTEWIEAISSLAEDRARISRMSAAAHLRALSFSDKVGHDGEAAK